MHTQVRAEPDRLARGLDLERLHRRRADSLGDAVGQRLVDGGPDGHCEVIYLVGMQSNKRRRRRTLARLDLGVLDVPEMGGNVLHVRLPLSVVPHLAPQRARLLEVD